jgi:hypothetical protein
MTTINVLIISDNNYQIQELSSLVSSFKNLDVNIVKCSKIESCETTLKFIYPNVDLVAIDYDLLFSWRENNSLRTFIASLEYTPVLIFNKDESIEEYISLLETGVEQCIGNTKLSLDNLEFVFEKALISRKTLQSKDQESVDRIKTIKEFWESEFEKIDRSNKQYEVDLANTSKLLDEKEQTIAWLSGSYSKSNNR